MASRRARLALIIAMALNACTPTTHDTVTRFDHTERISNLPPIKVFSTATPRATIRSNNDLALDFIELSFQLESGRDLPVFTRFEGPITLRVIGTPPATMESDLSRVLSRLNHEAGIPIRRIAGESANITVQAVSRAQIRRVLPKAACFVAPNVSSIDEYAKARRAPRTNWASLRTRSRIAIFVPNDVSPQETRDCLHEELAQALGPLNDLYRLPDSVFNDDNVHTVLTGFDMLMLRAYYAPELRSGMTRGQVAAALPAIFSRINPGGDGRAARYATRTPRAWKQAIETALGSGASITVRRRAGLEAIRIATSLGWQDHRRAFAHYAMGRLLQRTDPEAAHQQYLAADRYYAQTQGTQLHRAYVATQLAAYAISQGAAVQAERMIAPHLETAQRNENAALLSTLMLLRAEALDLQNRPAEARSVRLDSLGWARYGFGPDWAVRAKLREIASLNPLKG
ncbi:MAG: DUF2927 domain-containing protein [Sulfitobacter sp.]